MDNTTKMTSVFDKIKKELNWLPSMSFEDGLKITIQWYLDNETWANNITSGEYRNWIKKNYMTRI